MAATSVSLLTNSVPLEGPTSNNVVESASEAVAVLATTLTANGVFSGRPLSGSRVGPADCVPGSKLAGVCSEVETLLFDSLTCGSTLLEGSLRCTSHEV